MPFRRLKRYKKKLPAKNKADYKQNKAIYKLKKDVRMITKSEPKYFFSNSSHVGLVNASPKASVLNAMAQGNTSATREGNRMHWRYVTIRNILKSTSALTAPMYVRILLVRKTTVRGQAFTVSGFSELFADSTPDYLDNYNYLGINVKKEFKIYYDRSFLIGPARIDYTSTTGHNTAIPNEFLFTIKARLGFTTDYHLGNTGTVADIDMNGLFLLVFTDNSTAGAIDHYFEVYTTGSEI